MRRMATFAAAFALVGLGAFRASAWGVPAGGQVITNGSNSGTAIKGDGQVKSEERAATGFTGIDSNIAADIDVEAGATATKVTVETDGNLLPHLTTAVEDGVLKLRFDASVRTSKAVAVHVSMPKLETVNLTGTGAFKAMRVASGALTVTMSGASNVRLEGKADVFATTMSGAGTITATDLAAKRVTAILQGAGNIKVNAAETLDAWVSGVGNVTYRGSPTVTSKVTGVGRVRAE